MLDENKLIEARIQELESKGIDASLLKDDIFTFDQKFELARAITNKINPNIIANPEIPHAEMSDLIDEQISIAIKLRDSQGINPENYNFKQLAELQHAVTMGLDVSHYKDPAYSADQMYIAKSFQVDKIPGIEQLTPNMSTDEMQAFKTSMQLAIDSFNDSKVNKKIDLSTNDSVLSYFQSIDPELVAKIKHDGKIDVPGNKGGTCYLQDNIPNYLAELLSVATGHELPHEKTNDSEKLVSQDVHRGR